MTFIIPQEKLRQFSNEVLIKVGVPKGHAEVVTDQLVLANLRGVDSHGIIRLPFYVSGIVRGEINPNPNVKVVKDGGPYALIDGDNGIGQPVALKATEIAVGKAKGFGVSFVGIKNLKHIGMLGYYVMKIVDNGMVGFVSANASPNIAPLGCKKPITGTNPIAIGFPTKDRPPIILDMAMSVVARGKILVAAHKGEKIPEGWAMNKEGLMTTDPKEAIEGILLPFGGYKGFGLAVAVDILCGVVLGGGYSLKMRRGMFYSQGGVFIGAVDINSFRPYNEYIEEITEYINLVKSTPTAPGFEVLMPGEPEHRTYLNRVERGIPLDDETLKELKELSIKYGVEFPTN
ncbi:MAG: Ldh family oxidoreductase [Sulfolobales archaeon]|nr:Ldh family oxidoreductase [Sulfolobales archaeon]MCX8186046.1 Ldh family oxidoreductase [Sulfolobales archaeon]MDW7969341.1 Ldh family oxidoreductase [Sulfolobales archaeon]